MLSLNLIFRLEFMKVFKKFIFSFFIMLKTLNHILNLQFLYINFLILNQNCLLIKATIFKIHFKFIFK